MSFLAVIWTLTAYDAPFHLMEECSNAAVAAPQTIIITSSLGAVLGWLLVVLIGYTIVDIDEIVGSTLSQPIASYLLQVRRKGAGLGFLSVVVICLYFAGQTCLIVSSRLLFAYA